MGIYDLLNQVLYLGAYQHLHRGVEFLATATADAAGHVIALGPAAGGSSGYSGHGGIVIGQVSVQRFSVQCCSVCCAHPHLHLHLSVIGSLKPFLLCPTLTLAAAAVCCVCRLDPTRPPLRRYQIQPHRVDMAIPSTHAPLGPCCNQVTSPHLDTAWFDKP